MTTNKNRNKFRTEVFERDEDTCIVPWCDKEAADAHHIVERSLWNNGGYIPNNGASVCINHHEYAEENHIPPQAFYMWAGIKKEEIPLPESAPSWQINKWGEEFKTPAWEDLKDITKYPSTRHLLPLYWGEEDGLAKERLHNDDTGLETLSDFVGIPLVITEKMDGGNCMVVNDVDNPVRARNGKRPEDTMRPFHRDGGVYWTQEVSQKLPDRLQVFGEWLYAKHSIHYGCDCETPCEDTHSKLSTLTGVDDERAYFQIFGVYDNVLNLWLSWPETEQVAKKLGFPTTPVLYCEKDTDGATFDTEREAREKLLDYAHDVVDSGGEGIVVRSKFPFHYGQFERRLGKYVRENHVNTDEHWKHIETVQNVI